MTYVLSVATHRNLDLAVTLPSELAKVVRLCLRGPGYDVSQELAAIWISEGIDSVVFPSATGVGRNVVVYLAKAAAGCVVVRNPTEVLAALRRPRAKKSVTGSCSFLTVQSKPGFLPAAFRPSRQNPEGQRPWKTTTQLPTHRRILGTQVEF
jgi:hypothetical protein